MPDDEGDSLSKSRIRCRAVSVCVGPYLTALPLVADVDLVTERPASQTAHRVGKTWFLTSEGRVTVRDNCEDKVLDLNKRRPHPLRHPQDGDEAP